MSSDDHIKSLGILMYIDDHPTMLEDFSWIYKSWIYSGNWRSSDLVAVCNPKAMDKLPGDDPGIVKIPFEPVAVDGSIWQGYPFINSIACLSGPHTDHLQERYKWLLRTDADVFLTQHLCGLRPNMPVHGNGQYLYTTQEAWDKMLDFCQRHGFEHHRVFGCGHSLLALSGHVLFFVREQTRVAELVLRDFGSNPGQWPGWFRGVTTMYAAEIVANHHYAAFLEHGKTQILDVPSYSVGAIDQMTFHIHGIHTDDYFSKHHYRAGKYAHMDLQALDRTKINQYCHWIVTTPLEEIKRLAGYPY